MAASSSSALIYSLGSSFKYQVFLSFRGNDTRKGFTRHLYTALEKAGMHTFMDDKKIDLGEKFGERIFKAIAESSCYVVILSKGNADSTWCLRELRAMVDHMTESAAMSSHHKKEIIPVFYYVDPSHVRHQKGPFKRSFICHEKQYTADVEGWRQAMTEVGARKGPVIKDESDKNEVEVIREIVERVSGCRDNAIFSSSSALVPSPISSIDPSSKCQVFLSFRRVDTRQGFTWNLYNSLKEAKIETFIDENDTEAGEGIDERLLKAIGDSRYCVVILSSGYVDSKVCLMELAAMFRLNKEIIPVFFYVDPSDVRHQSGPFEIAFSTHKKRPFEIAFSTHQRHSNSSREVEEWRQAMTKVGQLKGFLLSDH